MRLKSVVTTALAIPFLLSLSLRAQVIWAGHCKVDLEVWKLPSCAVEQKGNELFILDKLVKPLGEGRWVQVGVSEVAWTTLPSAGFVYFDRTGKIVVTHVAVWDNAASPFHEGLVRVEQNDKWGLADVNGKLIVPLEYDGIYEFDNGRWLACKGCTTQASGEYHFFSGGSWIAIDRLGKIVGPVNDPTRK